MPVVGAVFDHLRAGRRGKLPGGPLTLTVLPATGYEGALTRTGGVTRYTSEGDLTPAPRDAQPFTLPAATRGVTFCLILSLCVVILSQNTSLLEKILSLCSNNTVKRRRYGRYRTVCASFKQKLAHGGSHQKHAAINTPEETACYDDGVWPWPFWPLLSSRH